MQEAVQSPGLFLLGITMNLSNSSSGPPWCPQSYDCGNSSNNISFDIGRAPSYVAIASSGLSCLGSFLVIATFLFLKEMRTGAQKIITLLAIADLISAVGYILGSINFLVHFRNETDTQCCNVFDALCRTQASITSWSSLCSFCWTIILALILFLHGDCVQPQGPCFSASTLVQHHSMVMSTSCHCGLTRAHSSQRSKSKGNLWHVSSHWEATVTLISTDHLVGWTIRET